MNNKAKRAYGEDRSKIVGVRLSATELSSLESKAKKEKMSKSEYIRNLLKK